MTHIETFTSAAHRTISFRITTLCAFLILSFLLTRIGHAAGFLHVRGEDIVDDAGQKIMLRGVGLGNWLLPEGYMWRFGGTADRPRRIEKLIRDLIGPDDADRFWKTYRRQYITEQDIRRIAELGFNSVRPALNARLFMSEGQNAAFLDEGFELLDNLVKWCKANSIYVIIDMHAAPGGQTGQNIDDSVDDQPLLFSDQQNQDRLVKLWAAIAARYKDEPTVAAYDLLNEPLPERTGAAAKYKDRLEPLYRRITQAIRAIDKRHMITLEGYDWANNWSAFSSRFDDNLVYQFHYYCWDNPDRAEKHSQVSRRAQAARRACVGRRNRGKRRCHLLGHYGILRSQQHRLVILALEKNDRRQWSLFHQCSRWLGRDHRAHAKQRRAQAGQS